MEIVKSSRHSKITGDFAEALVLYWLSRDGFECARIDHTGIDLLARNRHTHELMGISVKSRSRFVGTETRVVNIPRDNLHKARAACEAFGSTPHFAFVVDGANVIRCYLLSLARFEQVARTRGAAFYWQMSPVALQSYALDSEIKRFELQATTSSWWED
jgi:hypothetical protein